MVMLIISALAGVIIPKTARIMDTAILNYETKKFRSEFFFARSLGRSATYEPTIFKSSVNLGKGINFFVNKDSYRIEQDRKILHQCNLLQKNFKISYPSKLSGFVFASNGKPENVSSGTYTFTSPMNNKRYLRLDSVGRLQVDEND